MMDKLRNCVIVATALICSGAPVAMAQTTIAASAYGAFHPSAQQESGVTTTVDSPSNQAGFLLELRHISNPLMGYEVTYSYHRANEAYTTTAVAPLCPGGAGSVGTDCGNVITSTAAVPANAHEVTADWVFSFKLANLKPFALVGGGVLFDEPTTGSVTVNTLVCPDTHGPCSLTSKNAPTWSRTKGVLVYGAGLDWTLLPHIGLRFQYRGNVYKTSSLMNAFMSSDKFTQSAEPMAGVFFRF